MIRDNHALYATIRRTSDELRRAGEEEASLCLMDALSISTVPGEVLGEIRLQLQSLKASGVFGRVGVRSDIDEAISYIDEALS